MSDNEEAPKLDLQDLVGLMQAINTASERGAFRTNEYSTVGKYYDRIYEFIEYAEKNQNEEPVVPDSEQSEGQGNGQTGS